jgi:hypothetical protein
MPEPTLQLIAATFADRGGAPRALEAVLRARAATPYGILDAAAVTRSSGGGLLLQGAAEPVEGGGFSVSAVMGEILRLLESTEHHAHAPHRPGVPAEWRRAARALEGQLRGIAVLLTAGTSALVTLVAPAGAADVVGAVLDEASKLAVEDLPAAAVRAIAGEPALVFAGAAGAASLKGPSPCPHPAFARYLTASPAAAAQPPA